MSIVTPERPVDAASAPTPSRPRRTWWHAFNSVIALGAAVIGVIALTRDPATKTVEVPAPAATTSDLSLSWLGDPGPPVVPSGSYANGGISSPATGGVPSDKYADRVPAYQYDIAKEHAPVSPTGPMSPR
jgi:hypothetical protein